MLQNDITEVNQILSSDHALLLLDSNPIRNKTKARFIFEARWTKRQECEELVKEVWNQQFKVAKMYNVQ